VDLRAGLDDMKRKFLTLPRLEILPSVLQLVYRRRHPGFDCTASNIRMIDIYLIGKDLKGSGRDLFEVITWYLCGQTGGNPQ
jgi:hypothetical protein